MRPASARFVLARRLGIWAGWSRCREEDAKGRSAIRRAFDVYLAARLANDPEDRREAQPRALTGRLGGEKRLEHMRECVWTHPDTGVAHHDHREGPGLHVRHLGRVEIELARFGVDR